MPVYELAFKTSIEKDIKKISPTYHSSIYDKINNLSETPRPAGSVKLTGSDNLYRIRSGNYRIVYDINDRLKKVTIYYIRHRKDIYRDL
jgi:mRNA interferase RelE/StbE